MRVIQVRDSTPAEPDHVYVMPPDRFLSIRDAILELSAPTERRGLRMPIDFFLRSLAEDQGDMAIGIVLSGTGTDGTLGLKEVKAAGGMTMAHAQWGVAALLASSAIAKTALAFASGNRRYGALVGAGLIGMAVVCVVVTGSVAE